MHYRNFTLKETLWQEPFSVSEKLSVLWKALNVSGDHAKLLKSGMNVQKWRHKNKLSWNAPKQKLIFRILRGINEISEISFGFKSFSKCLFFRHNQTSWRTIRLKKSLATCSLSQHFINLEPFNFLPAHMLLHFTYTSDLQIFTWGLVILSLEFSNRLSKHSLTNKVTEHRGVSGFKGFLYFNFSWIFPEISNTFSEVKWKKYVFLWLLKGNVVSWTFFKQGF